MGDDCDNCADIPNSDQADSDGDGKGDACEEVSLSQDVQPIFTRSCAITGCHAGSSPRMGLSLEEGETYDETVNVPSQEVPEKDLVEPGDSANSYLYEKISTDTPTEGSRMPSGNPEYFEDNPEELVLIREWIDSGAPDN